MDDEKTVLEKAVIEFCKEIITNPLIHFNESDLHILLYNKLNRNIKNLDKPIHSTGLNPLIKDTNLKYNTCLLHLEYGANKGRAMDITIFDKDDIKNINHYNLQIKKDTEVNYLRPKFGFEIGTEKIGLDKKSIKDHLNNDLTKLQECKKNGYLIHIIRDTNLGEQKQKIKNLTDRFKIPIQNNYKNLKYPDKIKIIAILIYLFRKNGQVRVEIFCKNKWHSFTDIELKNDLKIESILKKQIH